MTFTKLVTLAGSRSSWRIAGVNYSPGSNRFNPEKRATAQPANQSTSQQTNRPRRLTGAKTNQAEEKTGIIRRWLLNVNGNNGRKKGAKSTAAGERKVTDLLGKRESTIGSELFAIIQRAVLNLQLFNGKRNKPCKKSISNFTRIHTSCPVLLYC
jgi:hypothetical protein